MADKLAKVRRKFVEQVSIATLDRLLDNILEDHIVNDLEKDSILKGNSSREKARCLIDTVRKKGDRASMMMIAHLQNCDLTLYSELGLGLVPPAPPAAEPRSIKEEGRSTTLIPTTEDFWREKQNQKDIYPVTKDNYRNRVALLITNIKFTLERFDRRGAEKDEENAEKLLTDLGYEVVKHTNLTAKAIDDAVIKFSKHPKLRETDSVMVVIMSHGKLGTILGVDWKPKPRPLETSKSDDEEPDEFPIDNIYKHLGPEECPALLNQTKILIIQACRGDEKGFVLLSDRPAVPDDDGLLGFSPEHDIEDDCLRTEHKEKDFISLLSCTPDTVSYRLRHRGSFLIQFIVDVFNTAAREDDIEELFRKVMQRFEEFRTLNIRQMPTKDRCTLTKRFYFYPGLNVV
ncbi:caspase a [Hippoglossus stenolepis]|uniref:caspase a n=1 Tax=Hippoglossus stenolepis TaxID=195615 RepID=UPI00159C06F6|nr:caspase a [Hippoglossus stenolepis]